MTTNDRPPDLEPLVAHRRIAVVPRRSVERAWQVVQALVGETLTGRGFAAPEKVLTTLQQLRPVAHYLLAVHALEEGWMEFECPDLRLVVTFAYGADAGVEELHPPPGEGLDELAPEADLGLTFVPAQPLDDPFLQRFVKEINREGVLTVRIADPEREESSPDEDEVPGDPNGEDPPEAQEEERNACNN